MLVPISCNGCGVRLREFHSNSGFIDVPGLPNLKISAAVLICLCGHGTSFDGKRARKNFQGKGSGAKMVLQSSPTLV
jgi:hypothetical protein